MTMRILGILILTAGLAGAQQVQDFYVDALERLRVKLSDARKTYTENSPQIAAIRDQIRAAEEGLLARQAQGEQAKIAELRARAEELRSVQQQLRALEERARAEQAARSAAANLPETWWRNNAMVVRLGLSAAQVKGIEEVFQQTRLKLIDQKAALDKEEATLEPLVAAETLNESRVATQIDRVAQARAELEKTRGRMLLGIRKQLDAEQWRKLNETRFTVDKLSNR